MHDQAGKAAQATHCAGEQGKYWEMHDRLFASQRTLSEWSSHAEAVEIDTAQFLACLESNKYDPDIARDVELARSVGFSGTPSFLIGITNQSDPTKVTGVSAIIGARPLATFISQIDTALEAVK